PGRQGLPVEPDLARLVRQYAREAFEERRLACAVGPDEAEPFARADRQRHVGEGGQPPVRLRQAVHCHHRIGHLEEESLSAGGLFLHFLYSYPGGRLRCAPPPPTPLARSPLRRLAPLRWLARAARSLCPAASPLALPHTLARSALRRLAPLPWLPRAAPPPPPPPAPPPPPPHPPAASAAGGAPLALTSATVKSVQAKPPRVCT